MRTPQAGKPRLLLLANSSLLEMVSAVFPVMSKDWFTLPSCFGPGPMGNSPEGAYAGIAQQFLASQVHVLPVAAVVEPPHRSKCLSLLVLVGVRHVNRILSQAEQSMSPWAAITCFRAGLISTGTVVASPVVPGAFRLSG